MPSRINGPLAHYLTEELPLAIENHGRSAGFSDWSVAAADRIRRCPDRMCHSRVCPRCTRIEARGRANEYRSKISGHSIPWGHSWGHFVLAPAWTGAENVDHDAYREAVQKIGSAVRYLRRNFWTEPRIAGVCRVEISPAGSRTAIYLSVLLRTVVGWTPSKPVSGSGARAGCGSKSTNIRFPPTEFWLSQTMSSRGPFRPSGEHGWTQTSPLDSCAVPGTCTLGGHSGGSRGFPLKCSGP
jgi:hypothetical protein